MSRSHLLECLCVFSVFSYDAFGKHLSGTISSADIFFHYSAILYCETSFFVSMLTYSVSGSVPEDIVQCLHDCDNLKS